MKTILEPCDDVAAFADGEAEAIVAGECDVHPSADKRSVAVGATPCLALIEDHDAESSAQERGMKGAKRGAVGQRVVRAWRLAGEGLASAPNVFDRFGGTRFACRPTMSAPRCGRGD
jgi:hypothetical protein